MLLCVDHMEKTFYYRIASLTLKTQRKMPHFEAFECEETEPDVIMEETEETPADGQDIISGDMAHRKVPGGWFFHSNPQTKTGLIVSDDYARLRFIPKYREGVTEKEALFIRVALECRFIQMGYVSLHAAAVELDGKAYAFTGPSGMGKSTRAEAWGSGMGATLISGDRPLIDSKTMTLYGVPWDGKEQNYRNESFELAAIFDIRRSPAALLRKMRFEQRRRLLLKQCFMPMWDNLTAAAQIMNISRLASDAQILRTFCGPEEEDGRLLYETFCKGDFKEERTDMKAKSGFILRNIVGEHMLMPVDDNIGKFDGTVLFNDVSAFIWEKMKEPVSRDDLLKAILDEYEVDEATAAADLDNVLKKFEELDIITNE